MQVPYWLTYDWPKVKENLKGQAQKWWAYEYSNTLLDAVYIVKGCNWVQIRQSQLRPLDAFNLTYSFLGKKVSYFFWLGALTTLTSVIVTLVTRISLWDESTGFGEWFYGHYNTIYLKLFLGSKPIRCM